MRSDILVLALLLMHVSYHAEELQAFAERLPSDEVALLKTISSKMKNSYWNITEDSCHKPEWNQSVPNTPIQSTVTCDCTFEGGTVCHVTNFVVKGYNLSGIVPDEFGNLTYLQEIDLARNYLNGTILTGVTRLSNFRILNLSGNRLSGTIPKEIARIRTLEQLVLVSNLLTGPLPEELGNLPYLSRLLLSANNFTGTIPGTFSKLENLTDFRIDGNPFSGSIPDFIGNWSRLARLDIQGTSLTGPLPVSLSLLTNLLELRISDLTSPSSSFPNLAGSKSMARLTLRNCLLSGPIPSIFDSRSSLRALDLSNNQLTGEIPSQFEDIKNLSSLILTNNSLTGSVPSWIAKSPYNIDLSYNNFTEVPQSACQLTTVNLASSSRNSTSNSIPWCAMSGLPCLGKSGYTSLFINCGGKKLTVDKIEYEEDLSLGGISAFESVSGKWAYSSTGVFVGREGASYLATNTFNLSVADYYASARLSPLSLRYYGLCLRQGGYNVKLHFAEIMFSNDSNFSSLGRRIFNVAIQGKVVLEDFNIAEKAGGAGIGIVKSFNTYVTDSTLEIHLFWLGKGTTAMPDRGVYGPLINAITVTPNFKVGTGLSVGAIAGIVVASIVFVALLLLLLVLHYRKTRDKEDAELRGLDLHTGRFTLKQIKQATNSFDAANKIGEGGFGAVYKGSLSDGTVVAVKQLSSKSQQGIREFVTEIGMISALEHPNLVRLYGCCVESNQLLLVYEYLENNCLARALFGSEQERLNLNWATRKKILSDIARGLTYLHEESRIKVVHRDIKATNVLIDKDLNAKISDFGLAKLNEDENTHISTRIAGTVGYMAPEYAMRGYLTDKADVYSFGIVVLEIVSGKSNTSYRPKDFIYLLDWAYVLQEQGNLLDLVDPSLKSDYSKEEALRMLNLALLCANPSPTLRPKMSFVISMMEGKISIQVPIVKHSRIDAEARFKALEILSQDSQTNFSGSSYQGSMTIDAPSFEDSSCTIDDRPTTSLLNYFEG